MLSSKERRIVAINLVYFLYLDQSLAVALLCLCSFVLLNVLVCVPHASNSTLSRSIIVFSVFTEFQVLKNLTS